MAVVPSMSSGVQGLVLAGVAVERTLPWLSTAKQRLVLGQDTEFSWWPESIETGALQPPLVGVVV